MKRHLAMSIVVSVMFILASVASGMNLLHMMIGVITDNKEELHAGPVRVNKRFQRAIRNLGDPDILKISDDEFYVVGSSNPIIFYKSSDLKGFVSIGQYVAGDDKYTYCRYGAADLEYDFQRKEFILSFQATRVPRGQFCGPQYDEIFITKGPSLESLSKSPKKLVLPHDSRCQEAECYPRIDISTDLATGRYYYVWFRGGNNISSVRISDRKGLITHTVASNWDSNINEGPSIFFRNGKKYLVFAKHDVCGSYTSSYIMGGHNDALTRNGGNTWDFATPIQFPGCGLNDKNCLIETAGHGDVTSRNGQYYYIYHKHWPIEKKGCVRDTYITPIYFHSDGRIVSITKTNLHWNQGGDFRLDVKPRYGVWVISCLAGLNSGEATFNGLCSNAPGGPRVVHKGEVDYFRLCSSDGDCYIVPNDISKDDLYF